MYPLCTVLDDSIGCAIWFAARGKGVIDTNDDGDLTVPYASTARVRNSGAIFILTFY